MGVVTKQRKSHVGETKCQDQPSVPRRQRGLDELRHLQNR